MMNKRINTNPRRGAKHWISPSRLFWKSLRGMLNHKTPRGAAALDRLKCFEGIPFPYDQKKRMVIPEALKCLRMRSNRRFCVLGDLCHAIGWSKGGLVKSLEEKRKAKSAKFFEKKTKKVTARKKALADKSVAAFNADLAKLGF